MALKTMLSRCTVLGAMIFLFALVGTLFAPKDAHALAQWARKYNVDCNMCHTFYPQLNKTGYIFRANGYRMADEGKDEEFKIGDYMGVRGFFQLNYGNTASSDPLGNAKAQFRIPEIGFFSAGPIPKSPLSYFGEFIFNDGGEENALMENFFFRYVKPAKGGLFYVKLGQAHAIEGYMGLDRPLTLGRPFVLGKKPGGVATTAAWHDERGVLFGYLKGTDPSKPTTSLSLSILNGLGFNKEGEATSIVGDPQQNANSAFDVQFIGTHFFDDKNALNLYYYNGKNPQVDGAGAFTYENSYNRWGLFGNYYVKPQLNMQLGWLTRSEQSSATKSFNAKGWYLQGDYEIKPDLVAALRYDSFNHNDSLSNMTRTGWTIGIYDHIATGTRVSLQYETSKTGAANSTKQKLTTELQVMW